MNTSEKIFRSFAALALLFDYPEPGSLESLMEIRKESTDPNSGDCYLLDNFLASVSAMDLHAWQEYFIGTFDVNALASMDIGYVLFGEDYKRGDFLAMVQQERDKAGNPTGHELADHLPNILRLLPQMQDEDLAEELACSILKPAIREILKREGMNENIYSYAFSFLLGTLEDGFPGSRYEEYVVNQGSGFENCSGYACGSDFLKEIDHKKF